MKKVLIILFTTGIIFYSYCAMFTPELKTASLFIGAVCFIALLLLLINEGKETNELQNAVKSAKRKELKNRMKQWTI